MLTTFCIGFLFSCLVKKLFSYTITNPGSILMAGFIIATVYAQIWSLFGGVGMAANLAWLSVCVVSVVCLRKQMGKQLSKLWREQSFACKIILVILYAAWAYFASRGYFAYDSDLYHGQSIRWIEEYGVVKGLGNLHERFAYNSSYFAVSALFSMKFLVGRSLHGLGGYLAFLLSAATLDVGKAWKRKGLVWSDYARIAAIYYLATITDEVSAPASDFAIMCMLFWIVIRWIAALEDEETKKAIAPFALLCVAGVYALTLKLTAGLILLLLIKPAGALIREKRGKEIALYLGMGLLVAVPWFVRTVLISGWLLYPFESLDLFDVDWKMHPQVVAVDAANIKTWARGLYQTSLVDMPITEWFPIWFKQELSRTEKLLILVCIAEMLLVAGILLWHIFRKNKTAWDEILVMITVMASYLFWQCSAPLMRYGYANVLLMAALPVGFLLTHWGGRQILVWLVCLYGVYKLVMIGKYAYDGRLAGQWFWPPEYGQYEVESYQIEDFTFYYPLYGDRTGYDAFPGGPERRDIQLRGDGLEDGFRHP